MRYPVVLTRDGDGYAVSFPDIPEALTSGPTEEAALAMAADALATAMEFYFEDKRSVPMPGKIGRDQHAVALPASLWAKVLLLNEMLAQQVKPAELARRLSTRPQDVQRLIDLGHATKIDTIEQALGALGMELTLDVRRAPQRREKVE